MFAIACSYSYPNLNRASLWFFCTISDEIFTLMEPYLKLPEKLSREMAITILHATLKSFWENRFPLTESDPSSFSPGPYIIGSLVPRCFDCSKLVQSTALTCLELLVRKIPSLCFNLLKKFSESFKCKSFGLMIFHQKFACMVVFFRSKYQISFKTTPTTRA